ncbi:hypothetical protein KSF_000860 [Reticulibacter mediterranei]|uniref:Mutator family transposase n=1 Tax=Reticulibacter mediterranei TaxID=2778369 RepID=A0A8J3MZ45_9CHLR|nr:transposase [Reticulibacter mediterranei]GHO90038.1 hypothetical protein KSF_000860 [Reticulibacter mediterranei]
MPANKKQHTTSSSDLGAGEPSSPPQEMVQQGFHQALREKIRGAVRIVIEEMMDEELTLFLGAAWGECSPERKGYRNGTYTRDLATTAGLVEDLSVPRDREGAFRTQVFERYQRYEPHTGRRRADANVCGRRKSRKKWEKWPKP